MGNEIIVPFVPREGIPGQDDRAKRQLVKAFKLTDEELTQFFTAYRHLDNRNRGFTTADRFYRVFGIQPNRFYDNVLWGGNPGRIVFSDFVLALERFCSFNRSALVTLAFRLYDADGSGVLEWDEFEGLVTDLAGDIFLHKLRVRNSGRLPPALATVQQNTFATLTDLHAIATRYATLFLNVFTLQRTLRDSVMGIPWWDRHTAEVNSGAALAGAASAAATDDPREAMRRRARAAADKRAATAATVVATAGAKKSSSAAVEEPRPHSAGRPASQGSAGADGGRRARSRQYERGLAMQISGRDAGRAVSRGTVASRPRTGASRPRTAVSQAAAGFRTPRPGSPYTQEVLARARGAGVTGARPAHPVLREGRGVVPVYLLVLPRVGRCKHGRRLEDAQQAAASRSLFGQRGVARAAQRQTRSTLRGILRASLLGTPDGVEDGAAPMGVALRRRTRIDPRDGPPPAWVDVSGEITERYRTKMRDLRTAWTSNLGEGRWRGDGELAEVEGMFAEAPIDSTTAEEELRRDTARREAGGDGAMERALARRDRDVERSGASEMDEGMSESERRSGESSGSDGDDGRRDEYEEDGYLDGSDDADGDATVGDGGGLGGGLASVKRLPAGSAVSAVRGQQSHRQRSRLTGTDSTLPTVSGRTGTPTTFRSALAAPR